MVYRVYVEKKEGLDNEARALLNDARSLLGIKALERVPYTEVECDSMLSYCHGQKGRHTALAFCL